MTEPRFLIVALLSLVGHAPIIGFYLGLALAPESIHETERLWWILVQFFLVEMAACGLAVFFGHGFASTAPALRASGPRERTAAILVAALSFLVLLPWFVASTLHDTDLGLAVALPFLPRLLLAWRARGETRRFARALGRSGLLGWGLAVVCLVVALVSDLRLAAAIAGYYLLLCIATTALFRDAHLSS